MGRSREYVLWKHGRHLTHGDRLRGAAIDAVVYGGQAVIDRNADAIRGRFDSRRILRNRQRPSGERVEDALKIQRSVFEALAIRRSRRP